MRIFEVGGSVRDRMLGLDSKDKDFAVEAESFDTMVGELKDLGYTVFLEKPEFLTIRAKFPKGHKFSAQTADFVLCRKDGTYTDGRRPDFVEAGTIYDDLARRDFTVNAMAVDSDGTLIDPHGGNRDLADMLLRTVGDPMVRFGEDYLRAVRAIRFAVTKKFKFDTTLIRALDSNEVADGLRNVSVERIREEMFKAFKADTFRTIMILNNFPRVRMAILDGKNGLWLEPTLKER